MTCMRSIRESSTFGITPSFLLPLRPLSSSSPPFSSTASQMERRRRSEAYPCRPGLTHNLSPRRSLRLQVQDYPERKGGRKGEEWRTGLIPMEQRKSFPIQWKNIKSATTALSTCRILFQMYPFKERQRIERGKRGRKRAFFGFPGTWPGMHNRPGGGGAFFFQEEDSLVESCQLQLELEEED